MTKFNFKNGHNMYENENMEIQGCGKIKTDTSK
jgi:hypothetical protein